MTEDDNDNKKIFSSFYIVGCDYSNLQKYKEDNKHSMFQYIQDIDLFITNSFPNENIIRKKNEKWIKIMKNSNVWFRIKYTNEYNSPITELKIIECNQDQNNILFPKNYIKEGYKPIIITYFDKEKNTEKNPNLIPISKEFNEIINFNENFVKIPLYLNSKQYLKLPAKKECVVLAITRTNKILPIKDIYIKPNIKNNLYQFIFYKHNSHLSQKYMPKILESYPPEEEPNPSIALFCFPEGIKISEEFAMPKWFNFVLTDQLGERTYGTILYFKEDLDLKKINIKSFISIDKNKSYFIEKGICILSKFPFYYNSKLFLKELYRIAFGNGTKIPLERIICNFVDSLYINSYDRIIRYNINEISLDFYQILSYGCDLDTNNNYFDFVFRILDFEIIINAWKCLLLEKKLFILCSSKSTLLQVSNCLINLLFPFIWNHIYIPILPEKMKLFLESPVPCLIGISFPIPLEEIPNDGLILNIDKNCFENLNDENIFIELPSRLNNKLEKSLLKIKEKYIDDNPINTKEYIEYQDEVFPYNELPKIVKINPEEITDAFYNIFVHMFKNYEKFFIWEKDTKNHIGELDENDNQITFLKDVFLKSNDALNNNFLIQFTETSLITQFINCFNPDQEEVQKSMVVFLESIKNDKGKNQNFQNTKLEKIEEIPKIDISDLNGKIFFYKGFKKLDKKLFIHYKAPKIPYKPKFSFYKGEWCYDLSKLKKREWPKYFYFIINNIWFTFFSYVLNFYEDNQAIILMDYALSLIENMILTKKIPPTRNLFSKVIKSLGRNSLTPFMKQILKIVSQVYKKNGNNCLFQNDYLNGIYALSSNDSLHSGLSLSKSPVKKHFKSKSDLVFSNEFNNKKLKKNYREIESNLKKIIFLNSDLCPNCFKNRQITKKIYPEEILAGFYFNYEYNKNQNIGNNNYTLCNNCFTRFQPKIYYLKKNQNNLIPNEINILSPINLIKEIDKIFSEKGEKSFYEGNNFINDNVYLNIIFYFELFDLPLCVLYVENDMDKFEKIKDQLKRNLERKNIIKKKNNKNNYNMTFTSDEWRIDINQILKDKNNDINLDNNLNKIKKEFNFVIEKERELWKNIQEKIFENKKEEIFTEVKIEDKDEIISFLKDLKEYMDDSSKYFINNSEVKLKKFLIDLEKQKEKNIINLIMTDDNDDKKEKKEKSKNRYLSVEKNIDNNNKTSLESIEIKRNIKMFKDLKNSYQ